jgi:hypothetical protein
MSQMKTVQTEEFWLRCSEMSAGGDAISSWHLLLTVRAVKIDPMPTKVFEILIRRQGGCNASSVFLFSSAAVRKRNTCASKKREMKK